MRIEAIVATADQPPEVAPIVRIADDEEHEIAILAQQRCDLVFGVRTGADVLRLRPLRFKSRASLPCNVGPPSVSDTVSNRSA